MENARKQNYQTLNNCQSNDNSTVTKTMHTHPHTHTHAHMSSPKIYLICHRQLRKHKMKISYAKSDDKSKKKWLEKCYKKALEILANTL